jgi:hypothetical protein
MDVPRADFSIEGVRVIGLLRSGWACARDQKHNEQADQLQHDVTILGQCARDDATYKDAPLGKA